MKAMTIEEIIHSLKDQAQDKDSFVDKEDSEDIFRRDATALREAAELIEMINGLRTVQGIHPDGATDVWACARCGSGEYLLNEDGNRNRFCGQCGQAMDWSEDNG